MAQASTLKKCKAADQSGLEKECTQRPQCESLFFATVPPARRALMLQVNCGKRYQCVITPDSERDCTLMPRSSSRVQQACCWSLPALSDQTNMSLIIQGCTENRDYIDVWTDISNSAVSVFSRALITCCYLMVWHLDVYQDLFSGK